MLLSFRPMVAAAFVSWITLVACTEDTVSPTPAVIKDCKGYCQEIRSRCVNVDDADPAKAVNNAQYTTDDQDRACQTMCNAMAVGTATDKNVDTLKCRDSFLGSIQEVDPSNKAAIRELCYNAGPYSQACGNTRCAAFCKLNMRLCPGVNSPFGGSEAECLSACQDVSKVKDGFEDGRLVVTGSGNSFLCRAYHLIAASSGSDTDRVTHCPHTGRESAVCK